MGSRFNAIKMKLLKLVVFAAAAVAQEVVASSNASAVGAADGERAKYNPNDPDVCGNVKAKDMEPLKFQCKKGKKGKSCKVKCTKAPKNKDTPKKIFCKNNKWSN